MKFCKIAAFLLLSVLTLNCETDFEVNADWKEIAIVYGLLNYGDSVQYLRISKAYLNTNTNALEIARIPDSLYFDSLEVALEDMGNNNKRTILFPDFSIAKDTGLFQSTVNKLYRTPPNFTLVPFHRYRMVITNIYTGKQTLSETEIVGDPGLIYPRKGTTVIDFRPNNFNTPVTWNSGIGSKVYDVDIRVYYEEINLADTNIRTEKFTDMKAARDITTNRADGGENIGFNITGKDFYELLSAYVKPDPDIKRRVRGLSFRYYGGSDDLYTYMSVNKPSLGIVQKKPEFTNVNGGYGLFSSRNTFDIDPIIPVTDSTRYYMKTNPLTSPLNFEYP
jgi:hypothetical protein